MGLIIHEEDSTVIRLLSVRDRGMLLTALLDLYEGREVSTISGEKLPLIWPVLEKKVLAEKSKYEERCGNLAVYGRKGGLSKAKARTVDGLSLAQAKLEPSEQEQEQEQEPPIPPGGEGGVLNLEGEEAGTSEDAFDEWWGLWPKGPRKANKEHCRKKFKRLESEGIVGQALVGCLRMRLESDPEWTKDGGAWVEAPQVYLNQRRFEAYMGESLGAVTGSETQKKGAVRFTDLEVY